MKGSTKDICASHLSEDLARAENNFYTLYYARGFLINHQRRPSKYLQLISASFKFFQIPNFKSSNIILFCKSITQDIGDFPSD